MLSEILMAHLLMGVDEMLSVVYGDDKKSAEVVVPPANPPYFIKNEEDCLLILNLGGAIIRIPEDEIKSYTVIK